MGNPGNCAMAVFRIMQSTVKITRRRSACIDCQARSQLLREAVINASISQSVAHAAKGAAEIAGLKPKTGAKELSSARKQDTGSAG